MFNNVNDSNFYNTQLEAQSKIVNLALMRANSSKALSDNKNPYVDKTEISANAIELFQRDCDIQKFNKIALSDPHDFSHIEKMKDLIEVCKHSYKQLQNVSEKQEGEVNLIEVLNSQIQKNKSKEQIKKIRDEKLTLHYGLY